MDAIRVLIADDHEMVREGLRTMLELKAKDMEVVGLAADGREAVELSAQLGPDVILMDIRMPGMSGIEATRAICGAAPHPKILALTTFDEEEYALAVLREGASGFLLKDARAAQIINAIRTVHGGGTDLPPDLVSRLVEQSGRPAVPVPAAGEERGRQGPNLLPQREEEILRLWTRGLDNQEVAKRLCLSEGTVRNYASRIYERLGVRDKAQAVLWAVEHNLLHPDDIRH